MKVETNSKKKSSSEKVRVLIVQPALMHYRVPVYRVLANSTRVTIASSRADDDYSAITEFESISVQTFHCRNFLWQCGLCRIIRRQQIEVVWLAADLHYLSSLLLSFWCYFRGIKVILHGQGLIKKSTRASLRVAAVRLWTKWTDCYVAYTKVSADSMLEAGIDPTKIVVIENRFEVDVKAMAPPLIEATSGVVFIGRLRSGSCIEKLLSAMLSLNTTRRDPVPLHIIGDGEERQAVQEAMQKYDWVCWYGHLTDDDTIAEISSHCCLGVYPGRAGLSVLTYMRHGLAVVVSDNLSEHMGPEPSYVQHGFNGWLFEAADENGLEKTLKNGLASPDLLTVRQNAHHFFSDLHAKSYAVEMANLIRKVAHQEPCTN